MILKNHNLEVYLMDKAEEYAKPVRDFIDNNRPVYKGSVMDYNDEKCLVDYEEAVSACREWLRCVQGVLCLENEAYIRSQYVALELPDRLVEVEVCNGNSAFACRDIFSKELEVVKTPIGTMNYLTYCLLLTIKDNPVQLLYRHLGKLRKSLHALLTLERHCGSDCIIVGDDLLDENGIVDLLRVHDMDVMLSHVEEFLNGEL